MKTELYFDNIQHLPYYCDKALP